tara:strand:- start:15326 stop:15673 length:348 start_codon:yes stop_codon:yes gene_type:complete
MSEPFDFKNIKILKPITIITLLYSALMFIKYAEIFTLFFHEPKSPLLPKLLNDYAAFPSYIIVPFFSIIIILCIHCLKAKYYNFKIVYTLFGLVLLFYIFQFQIHQWIMSFNPYG